MKTLQQRYTELTGSTNKPDAIAANKLYRSATDILAKAYHDTILAEQMLSLATEMRKS